MARIGGFLRSDPSRLTRKKNVRPNDDALVQIDLSYNERELARILQGFAEPSFKQAGSKAIKTVKDAAVARGRGNIAAAGFPAPWVQALQGRQYPKGGKPSLSAEAFIGYRFGGVGTVFEFGSRGIASGGPITPIKGKWLWIPKAGTKKTVYNPFSKKSVRATAGNVGAFSKKGMKFAIISGQPALVKKKKGGKYTEKDVLFWGRKEVKIPKKWNVMPLIEQEAARLPNLLGAYFAEIWSRKGNG